MANTHPTAPPTQEPDFLAQARAFGQEQGYAALVDLVECRRRDVERLEGELERVRLRAIKTRQLRDLLAQRSLLLTASGDVDPAAVVIDARLAAVNSDALAIVHKFAWGYEDAEHERLTLARLTSVDSGWSPQTPGDHATGPVPLDEWIRDALRILARPHPAPHAGTGFRAALVVVDRLVAEDVRCREDDLATARQKHRAAVDAEASFEADTYARVAAGPTGVPPTDETERFLLRTSKPYVAMRAADFLQTRASDGSAVTVPVAFEHLRERAGLPVDSQEFPFEDARKLRKFMSDHGATAENAKLNGREAFSMSFRQANAGLFTG